MWLKRAIILCISMSCAVMLYQLNSKAVPPCVAASDEKMIETALELYIRARQPTGSVRYLEDGQSFVRRFLPYKTAQELRATNPACCTVSEPRDSEGLIYSKYQMVYYDVKALVTIKTRLQVITKEGFELGEEATQRFPMNSCGEVIFSLD